MAIKKIRMRPEGVNDYGDVLYPETSVDMVLDLEKEKTIKEIVDEHVADNENPHKVTSEAINHIDYVSADSPTSVFPLGISIFLVSNTTDYPQQYGSVVTYKSSAGFMSQTFYGNGRNENQSVTYQRFYHSTPGWGEWKKNVVDVDDVFVTGTYIGTASSSDGGSITILLGFRPSAVFVVASNASNNDSVVWALGDGIGFALSSYSEYADRDHNEPTIEVTSNGFKAYSGHNCRLNHKTLYNPYRYIAFK